MRIPQYKYVQYDTGEEELYNLQTDFHELENLAKKTEFASLKASLLQQMQAEIAKPPVWL